MLPTDYSIANGMNTTPATLTPIRVNTAVTTPNTPPSQLVVVPRSTVGDNTQFLPTFSNQPMTTLPMTSNFMANPRSLSALPTVPETMEEIPASSNTALSTTELAALLAEATSSTRKPEVLDTTSTEELLQTIRDLKTAVLQQQANKPKEQEASVPPPTEPSTTLVSASPRSSVIEA
jgi:hypothetical protein